MDMSYISRSFTKIQRRADADAAFLAARSGARMTYHPETTECRYCRLSPEAHIREHGILFCPEWALRDWYGK